MCRPRAKYASTPVRSSSGCAAIIRTEPNSLSLRRDSSSSAVPDRFGWASTSTAFVTNQTNSRNLTAGRHIFMIRVYSTGIGFTIPVGGSEMDHEWARKAARRMGGLLGGMRRSSRTTGSAAEPELLPAPRIGLALGGGFARGIAHAGVLKVLEQNHIPIHCITGVSAGAIVAAAYASGATPAEIGRAGCAMRFGDVGRWRFGLLGLVTSERMQRFLQRLLKVYSFEDMPIPLGVLATDLSSGESVPFYGSGSVF